MSITTNLLRTKRAALSIAGGSALLGAVLFTHHPLRAALSTDAAPLTSASVAPLVDLNQSVEAVAAHVTPAVVNIAVTSHVPEQAAMEQQGDGDSQDGGDPMQEFQRFFGQGWGQGRGQGEGQGPSQEQQQQSIEHGIGSGIIVSPDGYIVTNDHVVDGAIQIRVTLHDRRTLPARLIGVDKLTDLAVVKIDASNLPFLTWANSAAARPGETVLAFGSPFGYFQFSVTRGIISALDRPNPYSTDARKPGGYIQTDAAINPGNSGGPLVDAYGRVLGINTFLISDSGSFAGAGFAIPSQIAQPVVTSLIKYGKVNHGYMGIGINDVTPDNEKFFDVTDGEGAVVTQVSPGSPAANAGLRAGDVITALNGHPIDTASDLQMTVSDDAPGSAISLDVLRNGHPQTVNVTLGQLQGAHQRNASLGGGTDRSGKLGVAVTGLTQDIRRQIGLPSQAQGVVVEEVRPASPAEDAGLGAGDVILEVDRKPVHSMDEFSREIADAPAGQDLLLLVWSHGGASYRVLHPSSANNSGM